MRKYFEETAIFANVDKTVIKVDVEEDGIILNRAIIVSPNKTFNEFSEQVDIRKVHENTEVIGQKISEGEERYLDNLADLVSTRLQKNNNVANVFDQTDEELFQAKLKIFEIPEVKAASKEMKASIRKSKNIFETLAYTVAAMVKNS